jgi:cytochrome c oxidase cbb3-type subunit 3
MSTFWARWIVILIALNLGITLWLFVWGQVMKIPTEPDGTTGHVWAHGVLRESVRKLPLWWVLVSIATFVAAAIWFVRYPGLGNFKGTLGWTSVEDLQHDTDANDTRLEALMQPFRTLTIEQLAADPKTAGSGRRLFLDNCAGCHGTDATGMQAIGAPNLTDAEWLYGGGSESILHSIRNGRQGVMPALGSVLGNQGVNEVASYVLSLSGVHAPADWVAAGKPRFEALCVACHGADGKGNTELGAPNLLDNLWLYGGNVENVSASIRDGRNGVMPAFAGRMSDAEIRMIATWVFAQGIAAQGNRQAAARQ